MMGLPVWGCKVGKYRVYKKGCGAVKLESIGFIKRG